MTFQPKAMIIVLLSLALGLVSPQQVLARGMYAASSPSPSDGATGVSFDADQTTNLSWTGSTQTDQYQIYWGTDSNALELYATTTSRAQESPTLEPATTYYWRVDSIDSGEVYSSDVWQFRSVIPAFPGAEGFGAMANGGRGGDVYTVTNLNSSGEGSLRYGVENAPDEGRTIVFAVSGYIPISYNSDTGNQTIRIVQDNVTIAGQTAPGDGIGLKDGRILVTGSNAVLRHLRVRHGKYGSAGDCINLENSADNCILDHISLMFSTDENISFFNSSLDNFTMQYCTSSWGMERHNAGGLWDLVDGSCHHTLWAHHRTRNPKARPYGLLEWINNVTYHWRSEGFIMGDSESNVDWYANIIGCYYVSIADYEFDLDSTPLSKARIASDGNPNFHLYLDDTLIDADGDGTLDGKDKGTGIISGDPDLASTAFTGAPISVTTDDPLTAYKKVISAAGALRLDATDSDPLRDELDTLLIDSVVHQESILVAKDSPRDAYPDDTPKTGEALLATDYGISNSGFGTLNADTAPTDTDGDGMPDFWELSIGSDSTEQNHNSLVPSGAYVSLGYTLLDEYLHFCAIPHAVMSMSTASEPSSLTIDLSRYTRGFNIAPVTFSLSDIQNGSAEIQPDSNSVVFEPTEDFSGRARFDFTVTDGDGSTWTQTLAILVDLTESLTLPEAMTWQDEPSAVGLTSITMTAESVAGLSGLQYYFTALSEGGHDSGWQSDAAYTDTDLIPETSYTYTVKARLTGQTRDVTDPAPERTAMTLAWPELEAPLAYWPLDDRRDSDVEDTTGNGSDGTLTGNVTRTTGVFDLAFDFDLSTDNYVLIPSNSIIDLGDEDFSLSLWINEPISQDPGEHSILIKGTFSGSYDNGSGKRYQLYRKSYSDGGDVFRFAIDDNVTKSDMSIESSEVCLGEWVHIVAVRDTANNQLRLYGNDTLLGTLTDQTGSISQDEPMLFGAGCDRLDDIRLYGFVLDDIQIEAIGLGL